MELRQIKRRVSKYALLGVIVVAIFMGVIFYINQDEGKIIPVSKQELNKMIESKQTFCVYVGRPNCPDCQEFYPDFEKSIHDNGIKIYYFNTKVKVSKKSEMREYVKSLGINEIPAILEVNEGNIVTIYDGQIDDDMRKFYKKFKEE